jgi:hypothetical protein
MRVSLSVVGLALGALTMTAGSVSAHHAFAAEFDANRPIKVQGTVTKMEWTNPHAWIHMDVKTPDGKIEKWDIEAGAPNALLRRGWTKKSVIVGMTLVVEGYAAKDGSNKANGRDITLPDGKRVFIGSSGTGAPGEKPEKEKPE